MSGAQLQQTSLQALHKTLHLHPLLRPPAPPLPVCSSKSNLGPGAQTKLEDSLASRQHVAMDGEALKEEVLLNVARCLWSLPLLGSLRTGHQVAPRSASHAL